MTTTLGRRALAGAAALSALTLTGAARAQSSAQSTFDRIRGNKVLRIAALPGELPYFAKDIATGEWSGSCIEMAKDIAKVFDAKLEYVESTYGNSVLDLQSNKVDLAFALNPTPARALSIGFTEPMIIHPFGCVARKGLAPKTWSDINKPEIKIVYDIGSLHETAAKRYCPAAQLTGFKNRDECLLNMQSGRADVHILAAILGLSEVGKNPSIGAYYLLTEPLVALPSCLGIQREPDTRFKEVVNAWLAMARGSGQIREWMLQGLSKAGASPDQVPAALTF
jgi:polar amino acid transport system substrate-binding protein